MNDMSSTPLVLIVDEVTPLLRLLELELTFQGLRMDTVLLENDPAAKAEAIKPDAIVIGAVIPTPQIYDLLVDLRARVTSKLLFINGSGNDADTALALQMGADDSVSRPFLPEALGMHIRSLLSLDPPEATQLRRGQVAIDYLRRIVWKGEMKITLGTNEWGLLLALARSSGAVSPHDLLTGVWGDEYAGEMQFLELWINRLRVNMADDPSDPTIVLGDIEKGYWLAG
jgi:two-component system KDP operon response regulator KdpE